MIQCGGKYDDNRLCTTTKYLLSLTTLSRRARGQPDRGFQLGETRDGKGEGGFEATL